jgi:predicted enzyme related to lactoylglutathione lyase
MNKRQGYPTGVPCWVDTTQPDPEAAVEFYSGLFGWECQDVMPAGSPMKYYIARLGGGDVAAIGAIPERAPDQAMWNTYIWADDVDATVAAVVNAGGTVFAEPFDVMEFGRMAVFTDLEGAVFSVWQPGTHRGSEVVNKHGSLNFNTLNSRQLESARDFYGSVFGWSTLDVGGPTPMWTLPGYGDHLEEKESPGLRPSMAEMGAPAGFEDVVAAFDLIDPVDTTTPAHWGITFAVDNADETAARATELGGTIVTPPTDQPWVRAAVIVDPQGAVFTASQFVPPS